MKKLFYFYLMIFGLVGYGQTNPIFVNNLSPDGLMDNVFDHYGNKYNLNDIKIEAIKYSKTTNVALGTNTTPLVAGYFNLYLEDGCGLNSSDSDYINRRNVIVRVFTDISNFINSPLTTSGKRVNIWVRNIANIPNVPSNVAGIGSSFYSMPYNNINTSFGGIIDGEVWKTIHLGQDSYNNTVSPLALNSPNSNTSGGFYHGIVAFNFNTITWNTSLTATNITGLQDLYTVALHEITHALGFVSLINSSGTSKLGLGFNYYTRYDTKLKNFSQSQFLLNNTGACNSMYNYSFNSALGTGVLQPTGTPYCNNVINFVGSSTVPVYTPSTFSDGSSLSHFEPQCVSPIPNFVMNMSTPTGVIRRYLTPQERNTLGDIGYSVNTSFGVNTTYQGTTTYTGAITGIPVAGINDGIDSAGQYSYYGVATSTSPITINSSSNTSIRILSNDYNATGFECLQDVFDSTARFNGTLTSVNSTTTNLNVNYTTSVPGIHLLRYVPINGSQKGNITYIYVYVKSNSFCGTANTCDLIRNGNFETHSPTYSPNQGIIGDISNACNWNRANNSSPNYLTSDFQNTSSQSFNVPCGDYGYEQDKIVNNHAFAGIGIQNINPNNDPFFTEPIFTQLESSLLPNTTYQLSFDVSLADGYSSAASKIQAYFVTDFIPSPTFGGIANAATNTNGILLTTSNAISITEGWEKIIFNFTTASNSNQNTLCIGGITNQVFQGNTPAPPNVHSCNYSIFGGGSYYYIDNVSLISQNGGAFTLPTTLCADSQSLSDLRTYLSALPTNGVFAGPGVSLSNGVYSLNNSVYMNTGVNTISYTYTNSSNCSVTIYCNITVERPVVPLISGSASACTTAGNNTTTNTATIPAGYTALWAISPDMGAGTITSGATTGTVNITWTSLPAYLTLTITSPNGCSVTSTKTIIDQCACNCLSTIYFTATPSGTNTITFHALNSNSSCNSAGKYQWNFGDGSFLSSLNSAPIHTYPLGGSYSVSLTTGYLGAYDEGICSSNYTSIVTVPNSSGTRERFAKSASSDDFILYPNPTSFKVSFSMDLNLGDKVEVKVKEMTGKLVYEYDCVLKKGKETVEFDLPDAIVDGVYVVEITSNDLKIVKQLIVKK